MTTEERDKIVESLRRWMEQVDDDNEYGRMGAAMRRIRQWNPEDGDPMPYALEVEAWQKTHLKEPAERVAMEFEQFEATQPEMAQPETAIELPEPEPSVEPVTSTDPDDALQPAFDRANSKLTGGAFYAAMKAFETLAEQTTGRLHRPAEEQMYAARAALEREKRPLVAAARAAGPDAAPAAWEAVEAIDPDDPDAKAALDGLRAQAQALRIQGRMRDMIGEADQAVASRRLPALNRLVGEAEDLRDVNTTPALRLPLDDLVLEVTQRRDELREILKSPSTLIVTGNNRAAYQEAKRLLDEKVPTIPDSAGIMGGEAGTDVPTFAFMHKVREIYLEGLRKFADDRRAVAEGKEGIDPAAALQTLDEVIAALTDDVLTGDDLAELQVARDKIDSHRKSVELRLQAYKTAQKLVVAAADSELSPDEKYLKLIEARETYREYPDIEDKLAAAKSAVRAGLAANLEGEIAVARSALDGDRFDEASGILSAARTAATKDEEPPLPGSPLAERLAEVRRLEREEIPARKIEYDRLMERLAAVDELLDSYLIEPQDGILSEVRNRLTSLAAIGGERKIVDDRWQRLFGLEGVDTNWNEGRRAYERSHWKEAIHQLEPVAKSNHTAHEVAEAMLARAIAAQDVDQATTAEKENRVQDALDGYRLALQSFISHQPDAQTEAAKRNATAGLGRLEPFEKGDEKVNEKRESARTALAQAKAATAARAGSTSLLLPHPGYGEATKLLQEAAQEPRTTKAPQVEQELQEVYSLWEQAYSDGMLLARGYDDPDILLQGITLGETLEQNKLLTRTENKELLRSLRIKYLDIMYARLSGDRAADPQHLEDNRRERLSHTVGMDEAVEAQLAGAIADRVKAVMAAKRQAAGDDKGATAALDYLRQEMIKPEVYGSKALFEEQMQLLWEKESWDVARNEAENLRYRQLTGATELRQLWLDLTEAAQSMADNNFAGFEAQMQALREWFPAGGGQLPPASDSAFRRAPVWFGDSNNRRDYLTTQETRLKSARVDKLIRLAGTALIDGHQLKAAQYYAYAHQWNPNHPVVVNGLRQVGSELSAALNALDRRARAVTISASTPLADSLATARDVRRQMVDIARVGMPLGLTTSQIEKLRATADRLKTRSDGWDRVCKILDNIEDEKQIALRNPQRFREAGGGWELEAIVNRFGEATQEANEQAADKAALDQIISQQRQAVETLRGDADKINRKTRALLNAFDEEKFDEVIILIIQKDGLEQLWRDRQGDGFVGLENLIARRVYRQRNELRTLTDHRLMATTQKNDLELWSKWATNAVAAHKALTDMADKLAEPLEELRQSQSLVALKADCDRALALATMFLSIVDGEKPPGNPQSRAAELERDRVLESWSSDLKDSKQGTRRRIIDLRKEINDDIDKLAGKDQPYSPLQQLKAAMSQLENAYNAARLNRSVGWWNPSKPKVIPDALFRNADKYLRECRALDPNNTDVIAANKRLRELQTPTGP